MGLDKALLTDREGQELWRRQLALLEKMGAAEVLISCRVEQHYLRDSDAQLVHDRWVDAGPLSGIVRCLEVMSAERLLVLAVDLPGITEEVLNLLLQTPGQGGAVYHRHGFLEPLVAAYPKAMAESGRRRLVAGEFALSDWIKEAGDAMQEVEMPEEWIGRFVNINNPAAWQRWFTRNTNQD